MGARGSNFQQIPQPTHLKKTDIMFNPTTGASIYQTQSSHPMIQPAQQNNNLIYQSQAQNSQVQQIYSRKQQPSVA